MAREKVRAIGGMDLTLRPAGRGDAEFLADMLGEAMAWRPGSPRPADSVVRASRYVVGWPRAGDNGVVAEGRGPVGPIELVGATWYRQMPADDPGYGFVDAQTPEITIGVLSSWRGCGVGRRLLTALIEAAEAGGQHALSLSVEVDNFAFRLYEALGFRTVGKLGNAWTMVISLH